jgi:hypothetical protein
MILFNFYRWKNVSYELLMLNFYVIFKSVFGLEPEPHLIVLRLHLRQNDTAPVPKPWL